MVWVCSELSSDKKTCETWSVLEHENSFIPELSAQQRDEIIYWMIGIFAVAYVVKRIRRMLGA